MTLADSSTRLMPNRWPPNEKTQIFVGKDIGTDMTASRTVKAAGTTARPDFLDRLRDKDYADAYLQSVLEECPAIEHDSQVQSGAWVFSGSRVPVTALFENLRDGATIDDFIEWFPGIKREQVVRVLRHINLSSQSE